MHKQPAQQVYNTISSCELHLLPLFKNHNTKKICKKLDIYIQEIKKHDAHTYIIIDVNVCIFLLKYPQYLSENTKNHIKKYLLNKKKQDIIKLYLITHNIKSIKEISINELTKSLLITLI